MLIVSFLFFLKIRLTMSPRCECLPSCYKTTDRFIRNLVRTLFCWRQSEPRFLQSV